MLYQRWEVRFWCAFQTTAPRKVGIATWAKRTESSLHRAWHAAVARVRNRARAKPTRTKTYTNMRNGGGIPNTQNKFNRNEVVLMMLSNNFFKNSTPSIFALPHSKLTKTLNFQTSYLGFHPHDHPLVLNIASHSCVAFTYTKQSMSGSSHRVHSGLVWEQILFLLSWFSYSFMVSYGVYHVYSAHSTHVIRCKVSVHSYATLGVCLVVLLHHATQSY